VTTRAGRGETCLDDGVNQGREGQEQAEEGDQAPEGVDDRGEKVKLLQVLVIWYVLKVEEGECTLSLPLDLHSTINAISPPNPTSTRAVPPAPLVTWPVFVTRWTGSPEKRKALEPEPSSSGATTWNGPRPKPCRKATMEETSASETIASAARRKVASEIHGRRARERQAVDDILAQR